MILTFTTTPSIRTIQDILLSLDAVHLSGGSTANLTLNHRLIDVLSGRADPVGYPVFKYDPPLHILSNLRAGAHCVSAKVRAHRNWRVLTKEICDGSKRTQIGRGSSLGYEMSCEVLSPCNPTLGKRITNLIREHFSIELIFLWVHFYPIPDQFILVQWTKNLKW